MNKIKKSFPKNKNNYLDLSKISF